MVDYQNLRAKGAEGFKGGVARHVGGSPGETVFPAGLFLQKIGRYAFTCGRPGAKSGEKNIRGGPTRRQRFRDSRWSLDPGAVAHDRRGAQTQKAGSPKRCLNK